MNPLANYLEKFKKILVDGPEKKRHISSTIQLITKITLGQEQIAVKDGVVYITASPALKNELFINRKRITEDLQKLLNTSVVIR